MQSRGPASHVMNLHLAQRQVLRRGERLQPREGFTVHRQRARREAPLDLEVDEVAPDVGVKRVDREGRGGALRRQFTDWLAR